MKTSIPSLLFLFSLSLLIVSCAKKDPKMPEIIVCEGEPDYRQDMRDFIVNISTYAKSVIPGFIIIPQNGQELISLNGEKNGKIAEKFLNSIDATGREDLFYGYNEDDEPTPKEENAYLVEFCNLYLENDKAVLAIDYCSSKSYVEDSYKQNDTHGYISFAADERDLNTIPTFPSIPYHNNTLDINKIGDAQNFLYLINGSNYETKEDFITSVSATSYDLIIIDLFHNDEAFSSSDIKKLKKKSTGERRLVICYMSIGEAEDYRYYWNTEWNNTRPNWLLEENPNWEGNYKVRFWDPIWQSIIYGNPRAYLDRILDSKYDGVYLDLVDAYEYFE